MTGQQELTTMHLLKDTFHGTVVTERYRANQLASKTLARFTVLLLFAIAMLLLKCWY